MQDLVIMLFVGIVLGAYITYRHVNKKVKAEVVWIDEVRKKTEKKRIQGKEGHLQSGLVVLYI